MIFAFSKAKENMRTGLIIAITSASLILSNCTTRSPELKTGIWRGVIEMQAEKLPFTFELIKTNASEYKATVFNGEEKLQLSEVTVNDDSVTLTLHIFDITLNGKIHDDSIVGYYTKHYESDSRLPFKAYYNQNFRFAPTHNEATQPDFAGKYSVTFIHESKDTTRAIGLFTQAGNKVTGTFLTPTGDYRFLEGNVVDSTMLLSAFDGNHAYIFKATKKGENLIGEFYSGKSWYELWTGIPDSSASLPHPESLTYLKDGYEKLEFSFPDTNGKTISLSDDQFKNKVVIVQLLGSWCPNCMDETNFLVSWYNQNKFRGIEIIGLAYERKPDFEYASNRVSIMKEKLGIPYPVLIAGTYEKEEASKTLPMLNRVVAFPTTIFVGKDGKVKHIHTGFSGPGTGVYYDQFKQRFNEIVNSMLAE